MHVYLHNMRSIFCTAAAVNRPPSRSQPLNQTNNGPSSPSLNLLNIFSVQRRVRTHSRAGPSGIRHPRHATAVRRWQGNAAAARFLRGYVSALRCGTCRHRTVRVTARGPDAPSQDGKWSLVKVNKRREHTNEGRSRCHVERVASDPHFTQLRPE